MNENFGIHGVSFSSFFLTILLEQCLSSGEVCLLTKSEKIRLSATEVAKGKRRYKSIYTYPIILLVINSKFTTIRRLNIEIQF